MSVGLATPGRIALVVTALVAAAAALTWKVATPTPQADAEPPGCDDPSVLSNIQRSYVDAALNAPVPAILRVQPPTEVALVDHVARLDSPTMRAEYGGYPWGHSRYCKATLELVGGTTDTARWRIDARKTGPGRPFEIDPCFDAWMRKLSNGAQDCSFVTP